jgi:hypothetical protein
VKEIEPVQVVKHYRERFAKIEINEDGSINKGKTLKPMEMHSKMISKTPVFNDANVLSQHCNNYILFN